jgi:NAD(P)-dependent dehydrogenase (short-subunit alcohol dehydrogenase family)
MFKDKVIVITGSTQGIGKRTSEILAQKGAKIVINSRNPEKVDLVVDEFTKQGYDVLGVSGDVSDYAFCESLRNVVIERFGRIDYLINNAGLAAKGSVFDTRPEALEQVFKVNVFGSLYPTKAMLPEIIKSKGGILFISSLAGIVGLPSYSAYSGTKSAIVTLAESLKNELVEHGVFVGVNYPGFTENDENKKIVSVSGEEQILPKRTDVKVTALDTTVMNIINQIERRKFRSYSFQGKMIQFIYRLSPGLSIYVLKRNRHKIMKMD